MTVFLGFNLQFFGISKLIVTLVAKSEKNIVVILQFKKYFTVKLADCWCHFYFIQFCIQSELSYVVKVLLVNVLDVFMLSFFCLFKAQ